MGLLGRRFLGLGAHTLLPLGTLGHSDSGWGPWSCVQAPGVARDPANSHPYGFHFGGE